ncbi:MAG: isoleucyl-tRNA synthetase [Patescibacteria group bacterium]|nr:isoleucyl-tRNA synthetase [Patescibacteria group bacterium]
MNREEKILEYWKEKDIFSKSIENRSGSPYFSFYDGPPFATGKPHYGHILATTIKDTVLRYWTMKGYQVPRRVGWDCHGLPIENLIEKELGVNNKKQIEEIGIEKFNNDCRNSVFACVDDFQKTLERVGRWADYSNAYSTMDNNYIESVWWVFKQLWDKKLVEKNYRVSPYCPRCGTTLSNFEVNQGYKEVKDKSVYVKFKIEDNLYFLVWTTTPWTLPGNVALAVNKDIDYVYIKSNNETYIIAEDRSSIIEEGEVIKKVKGGELVGMSYEPLFDYIPNNYCKVLSADFVSSEDGTGIVHINPMHGEDDFNIAKENNLIFQHLVNKDGTFKEGEYEGEFVMDANIKIIDNLKERELFFKEELITHDYPHCWRCDSPLLYYAIESWYILVTKIKEQLVENNKDIHWVPQNIKEGRFGKWLEGARDWDVARSRFWGAPIPIWECECGEKRCIGSIEELGNPNDLHRPYIDEIKLKCSCGKEMKRTPEVFDCWFESGSMPYAQWHYPFENKELVEKTYPADFIAEGLDQTRGWFYTLHVLATALTLEDIGLGKSHGAFKNVIVNGLVLDDKGRKLSKKLKNYPAPDEIFDSFGADALRYFLLASTSIGEDYRFSKDKVKEYWRKVISGLDNCFTFFETYRKDSFSESTDSLLDKWIISRTEKLNRDVIKWMDSYELTKASRLFNDYIDDLSNWYIRRSRRRFQKPENEKEQEEATYTLHYAISKLIKLMAPFTPFITEDIFLKMKSGESVHLCDYPQPNLDLIDEKLEQEMENIRDIVNLALAERSKQGIKVRQALLSLSVKDLKTDNKELIELIKEEINVKEVKEDKGINEDVKLDTTITPELKEEGNVREIIRQIQKMRKDNGFIPEDRIDVYYAQGEFFDTILERNKDHILSEVLANKFILSNEDLKEINIDDNKIYLNIKKI